MKKIGVMIIMCMLLLCGCESKEKSNNALTPEIEKDVELSKVELEQIWMMINALDMSADSLSYKDLSNQDKIRIAFHLIDEEYKDIDSLVVYSKSSIESAIKRYFGNNAKIKMEDYKCQFCDNAILYKYNEEKQVFEYNNHGHGYSSPVVINDIVGAKQKGDKLFVSVARLYAGPESDIYYEDPTQLYKNIKDLNNLENMVMDIKNTEYCKNEPDMGILECDYLEVIKDYPDKFSVYTYTFIKGEKLVFDNLKLN